MKNDYSLMIHGGAGLIVAKEQYQSSLEAVLAAGRDMLAAGAAAADVVERCVVLLEDDPLFNAGRGSVLNEDGKVEMDAAIMSGIGLEAGAVAGVKNIRNPVKLARLVMERSEHVMLIGAGAMKFGSIHGVATEKDDYFVVERRYQQWLEAKKKDKVVLDHSDIEESEKKFGTVGAVCRDANGDLAAAVSTGGITNKKFGRVGDSPIIGAGLWAENGVGAIAATGFGEQFIRTALSKTAAEIIRYRQLDAQAAAEAAIAYLVEKVKGLGGVIVVDREGNCGRAHSSEGLLCGQATPAGVFIF